MLRVRFAALVCTLFLALGQAPVLAQTAIEVDLPAQPLGQALNALAQKAGIQIAAPAALVAGRQAPPLKGSFTAREALSRLLAGSGLEARQENAGFVVRRVPEPAAEQRLPEVRVVGAGETGLQAKTTSTLGPLGSTALLDTPYSVSVITQELIRNENPTRLTEALRYVPGVVNSQPGGSYYDQVIVRGYDVSAFSNYRKNNLPLLIRGDTAFENIERLELYKGPSAMFYGFNSPGGVINYITKRPPASGRIVSVQAGMNGFGGSRAAVDVGGRIGAEGQLGLRVNAGYEHIANHIRDFSGRRDVESLALDWRIGSDTLLQFDYDQQYKRTHIQPGITAINAAQIPSEIDPRKFLGQPWTYHVSDSRNLMLQLTHAFNADWSIRIAGNQLNLDRPYKYSNIQLDDKVTGDGLAFFGIYDQYYDTWSGQLQVEGRVRTGAVTHELIVGHSPQRYVYDEFRAFPGGAVFNIYNPTLIAEPFAPFGGLRRSTVTNRSSYVMDRITLSERWQAIAGVRHNDFTQTQIGQPTYEKSSNTPTLALVYKPLSWVSLYGSYMEGLERGGVAPVIAANAGELMPPLESKQYEAGVKAELARGLSLSAALFEISKPSEYRNAANVYVQDGEQVNKGAEFGVAGQLTRNLSLYGGATLVDAKLRETGNALLNGKRASGVPRQALSLYADYRLSGLPGWSVNGGVVHIGRRPIFADNSGHAPAYTLLNAGVRYEFRVGGTRSRIMLNIDNLTDEFYWDSVDSFGTLTAGVPRTVRIAAQFDF
ncbi:MAG: TonB-dependent receptor [Burkholderiales bacterium]|nr:TonB-dependent receptor [Burkholderiales bacterium]